MENERGFNEERDSTVRRTVAYILVIAVIAAVIITALVIASQSVQ